MVYEAGTINSSHGWIRKYPMEAHDLLPQLYYRGSEEHAPATCRLYPGGRGYNDILSFDARKAEFSPEELEKKGIEIIYWSDEDMRKLEEARMQVVAEMYTKDAPEYARILLDQFKFLQSLGYDVPDKYMK